MKILAKIKKNIKNPRDLPRKFFLYYILRFKPVNIIFNIFIVAKIFLFDYGFLKTLRKQLPINKNNKPLPWYTYPAIEYLIQLDLQQKDIFEYGIGYSSLFFAEKARQVISVEDDRLWFDKIDKIKKINNRLIFANNKEDYIYSIKDQMKKFDIIIIDASYRLECATEAVKYLNPGGMIILDNSDWFPESSKLLRESDLIEIDFSGFGPSNSYTWTTSIYLNRNYSIETTTGSQPSPSVGAVKKI